MYNWNYTCAIISPFPSVPTPLETTIPLSVSRILTALSVNELKLQLLSAKVKNKKLDKETVFWKPASPEDGGPEP